MRRSGFLRENRAEFSASSSADIAFLLIVFFMVTSVFSATKGLDIKLPRDEAQERADTVPAVMLQVLEDGSLSIDGRPGDEDALVAYLAPKLRRWPDKPVILRTLPAAPYAAMVSVYDTLRRMHVAPGEGGYGVATQPVNVQIPTESDLRAYRRLLGSDPFGH